MKLIDIHNTKRYTINLYFTSTDNSFSERYYESPETQTYLCHQSSLPTAMKLKCKQKYGNKLSSNTLFNSNKWNLLFKLCESVCSVTALHPQFYQFDRDNQINKYLGYNFKIPSLSFRMRKTPNSTHCVYSQREQRLYTPQHNQIVCLDFNTGTIINEYEDNWEWDIWKYTDNIINQGASICMVDNDRFMAIMNTKGRKCELYAMNETKLGIRIADACQDRSKNYSMYHEIYHKIITVGDQTAECYDFNKDKSMIVADYSDYGLLRLGNIWYSPFNPAVLYFSDSNCSCYPFKMNQLSLGVFSLDLRSGITNFQKAIDIPYRWGLHHLYLRG